MSPIADRNLLWGVLALQIGFITRDALVEAMTAWTTAKDRNLEDILVERGDLDPLDRDAIRPMFARHLAKHGGDAGKSLAALSSIGSVRDAAEVVDDPDVRASLGHVSADATSHYAADTRATASYRATPFIPGSIRYRRLRPHAKGNLGEVFVAHDDELHREVALKEIQDKHADRDDSRRRFLIEAEVTGGLEHPGIVPVYGLGRYPDGRPFYAMRLIKGDSLKEAIAAYHESALATAAPGERSLALRKLLRCFTDVCNAIAYAHSRGILHRDLKPGNIMVGKYGETLVVDWGLAKTTADRGPDADESVLMPSSSIGLVETAVGSVIGTPAYMPPEQAAGRIDELGPRSDVYSLGATLYHILTGRAPFERVEFADVLRRVARGDFPRPRSVVPSVPKGLEAICLMAMATRPADRYPSALALSADLDHWLADEPIDASPDRPLDRLARWSRRHRAATLAITATLFTLLYLVATSSVLIAQARRHSDFAIDDLARFKSAAKLADETRAAALAAATEARFTLSQVLFRARQTVADLITMIRDDPQLSETPKLKPLRESLLDRALAFSDGFVKNVEAGPQFEIERDDAYGRVDNLTFLNGQPIDPEPELRRSIATHKAISASMPTYDQAREGLANAHMQLANRLHITGRSAEAETEFIQARDINERLVAERSYHYPYRERVAVISLFLGYVQARMGQPAKAEQSYTRSRDVYRDMADERSGILGRDEKRRVRLRCRNGLGVSLCNLGILQEDRGAFVESNRSFLEAVGHQMSALEQDDQNAIYRVGLDESLAGSTRLARRLRHPAEAVEAATRRRDIWPGNARGLYNAARDLTLCVPITLEGSAERARSTNLAMETLEQAVAAGWNDFRHTANDTDLIPLRVRPDFQAMLAAMMDRAFPADPFARADPRR